MIIKNFRSTALTVYIVAISLASAWATPNPINDLSANSGTTAGTVVLHWTVPSGGTAPASYVIRYIFNNPINTQAEFDAAFDITQPPVNTNPPNPNAPGQAQSFVISGLEPGSIYGWDIESRDSSGVQSSLSNSTTAQAFSSCGQDPDDGKGNAGVLPLNVPAGTMVKTTTTFIVDAVGIANGGVIALQIPDFFIAPSTNNVNGPGYLQYATTAAATLNLAISGQKIYLTVLTGTLPGGTQVNIFYNAYVCGAGSNPTFHVFSQKSSCGILKEILISPSVNIINGPPNFLFFNPYQIVTLVNTTAAFDVELKDGCGNTIPAPNLFNFDVATVRYDNSIPGYVTDNGAMLSTSTTMVPSSTVLTSTIQTGANHQTLYYQINNATTRPNYIKLTFNSFQPPFNSISYLGSVIPIAAGITNVSVDKGSVVSGQTAVTFEPGKNESAYVNFNLPEDLPWRVLFSSNNFVSVTRTIYGFGHTARVAWDGYGDPPPGQPMSIAAPGTYSVKIFVGSNVNDQTCSVTLLTGGVQGSLTDIVSGLPIGGADIQIWGTSNRYTRTLPDGSFTAYGLDTGNYTVQFRKFGYVTKQVNNVSVTSGGTTNMGGIQLQPAATLRLLVTRPAAGPLDDITGTVQAHSTDYTKQAFGTVRFRSGKTTSDDGNDWNVTPTSYTDVALEPNISYQVVIDVPHFAKNQFPISFPTAGVYSSTATLMPQPLVSGHVSFPTNGNPQGSWVSIEAAPDNNLDGIPDDNNYTNRFYGGVWVPQGSTVSVYNISLPIGKYVLTAGTQGYVRLKSTATVVADLPNQDFPTFALGGTVSGTLTVTGDTSNLGANGFFTVPINVFSPTTGLGSYSQVTLSTNSSSTSSSYQLTGLDDGSYFLYLWLPGFGLNSNGPLAVTVTNGSANLNINLQQFTGVLTGQLTLPSGQSNYTSVLIDVLSFNNTNGNTPPQVTISPTGTYTVSKLGTDFYTVRAQYPTTNLVVTRNAQVTTGNTTVLPLDLSGATYSVSGHVTSAASAPFDLTYIVTHATNTPAFTPQGPVQLNPNRIVATLARNRNFNSGTAAGMAGYFFDPKETFIGYYNANGTYTISGLSPGTYRIKTSGEMDGNLFDGNEISESDAIVYVSNADVTGIDFTLTDGYSVSGTLRVASGIPENGRFLTVRLLDNNGNSVVEKGINLNGTSASFSLDKVKPGNYVLDAQDSFPTKYMAKTVSVQVVASNVANQEVVLNNASIIQGQLQLKKSGVLISAANYPQYLTNGFGIQARSSDNSGGYGFAQFPIIDANGKFRIPVRAGTYDVMLQYNFPVTDSDLAAGKKQFVSTTKAGIVIADNETKDIGTLNLSEGIDFTGTLRDSSGNPIPNVRVRAATLKNQDNFNDPEAFSDQNGKFVLHGIDPDGKRYYRIIASPRPGAFDDRYISDPGNSRYGQVSRGPIDTQVTTSLDFTLLPANSNVTAKIVTSDGGQFYVPFGEKSADDLPGAIVVFNKRPNIPTDNPLGDLENAVPPDGNLTIHGLDAGVYDFYFLAKKYGSVTKSNVTVNANQTVDLGTITLPAGFTLTGKITKSNGDPVNTNELNTVVAARDQFKEISVAKFVTDASGNILQYSIGGIQPNKAYSILGFDRSNASISLASNVTLTGDTSLGLTFVAPVPGVLAIMKKSGNTFNVTFRFDDALLNSSADTNNNGINDTDEILTLTAGNGTLSATTITSDRTQATVTYTPAANDTSFTISVNASFVRIDQATGNHHTISAPFQFFLGIGRQNSASFTNVSGGSVDLVEANDGSQFTAKAGFLGDDDTATADITLKAASTQGELTTSALGAPGSRLGAMKLANTLGLKSYPPEMAAAMTKLKSLDVDPFSSFYDIFLPAGMSHFFPQGKEARLCLAYDASATDPAALNIYYYNSATNEYVLEGADKSVDTDDHIICVDIAHASVFTVLDSSASVISGAAYTGELGIINFPNPFNLKSKTVTLQNPGSANASQTIEGTMIKVSVPATMGGEVEIQIFNVAGELVRTLREQVTSGAHNYFEWDGRNEHGKQVASGTYLARFTIGGANEKFFKMAVLK